jgi:hypothetical protein
MGWASHEISPDYRLLFMPFLAATWTTTFIKLNVCP